MLVVAHSGVGVEASNRGCLTLDLADGLCLMVAYGLPKAVVVAQRNNGLWQMVEVPTQNVGCIVHSVACPVQTLAISWWSIECNLEFFDSFL